MCSNHRRRRRARSRRDNASQRAHRSSVERWSPSAQTREMPDIYRNDDPSRMLQFAVQPVPLTISDAVVGLIVRTCGLLNVLKSITPVKLE